MNRLDALLAQQMIPAARVESARAKQRQLAARLAIIDRAKVRGQAGLGDDAAGPLDHDDAVNILVEPARRAVAVQEAVLRQIEIEINRLTLRAPLDGTVTSLSRQPGEVVAAGTEVLALVSGRPGVLVAELQEGMAARVQVGTGVTVRPKESFSGAMHGHIIELAPEVDEMIPRARPSPGIAAWGRRAAVQLDEGSDALPGQAFSVALD
jgi:multidrug resistance efflux pump